MKRPNVSPLSRIGTPDISSLGPYNMTIWPEYSPTSKNDPFYILVFVYAHDTACVKKKHINSYDFFLRNRQKSLVRIYNNIIDINNSFHKIFVLCNLDLWFKSYSKFCKVPLNLFGPVTKEPVWPVYQLLTISYSCLLERSPCTILQNIFMLHDLRVQSKI